MTGSLLSMALSACSEGAPAPEVKTYVAIGDSYTAAPNTGPPDGSDNCFRSTRNYPHVLARRTGMELHDVSCSAATTEAVEGQQTTAQGNTLPPQLDAVTEDTDLVTVRIGANDFNLIGRVVIDCVGLAATDPKNSPCTEADAAAGKNSVAARLDDLERRMVGVFDAIRRRAPQAEIIAIGYPQVFPAGRGCAALPLADGDLPFARSVIEGINGALSGAAADAGAEFVDVFATTASHDICGKDPWIAGSQASPDEGYPYHPYAEEAAHVAALVQGEIR